MPLLKQPSPHAQTSVFSLADVEAEAAAVLDRARAEADALLATARHDAEALRRQAADEGRRQGHAEGRRQGAAEGRDAGRQEAVDQHGDELRTLIAALTSTLNEFEAHRHALKDNVAADVTRLALAVAEKITKRQGVVDPQVLVKNIAATARLVADGHDVRVFVHPDQEQLLTDLLPRLRAEWPTLASAAVVGDPTLAPGGCRLASAEGSIDADLATQLEHLAAELLPETA